jgi:hypothetical protein
MVALKFFPIQSKYQCNYHRVIISVIIDVNIRWETCCKWIQTNVEVSWMLFQSMRCQLWKNNNCCLKHNGNSSLSWLVWDLHLQFRNNTWKIMSLQLWVCNYEFATMILQLWVCNYDFATMSLQLSLILQLWCSNYLFPKRNLSFG